MQDLESQLDFFGKARMNLFRVIDANINRASEGLRVLEDACRFCGDRQVLATELKNMRHDLRSIWAESTALCLENRDLASDEGKTVEACGEYSRSNLAEIMTSNVKRVQEALRSLEEFSKCESPDKARQLEALRYRSYDLEQKLHFYRPFPWPCLNVLITQSLCKLPPLEVLEQTCAAGASLVQLREKKMEDGEFLDWIFQAKEVADRYKTPLIVNDRIQLVQITGVAGVHLGQGDLPTKYARSLLKAGQWIGRSTHCIEQARQAQLEGADYIGVGPLYLTQTKEHRHAVGTPYLQQVKTELKVPYVGIGAVNREHLPEILAVNPEGLAICTAVIGHDEPGQETAFYRNVLAEITTSSKHGTRESSV
jgi:thiamine-phosphate pyrophosphorylase